MFKFLGMKKFLEARFNPPFRATSTFKCNPILIKLNIGFDVLESVNPLPNPSYSPPSSPFSRSLNEMSSRRQIEHFSTRVQDGDFNMPVGSIKRARAKMLKEGFGNLAKSFVEKMNQE